MTLVICSNRQEASRPLQEITMQAAFSLSALAIQPYDAYGKIHTIKLQHVLYRERIGLSQKRYI